jgi:hypothetical protein
VFDQPFSLLRVHAQVRGFITCQTAYYLGQVGFFAPPLLVSLALSYLSTKSHDLPHIHQNSLPTMSLSHIILSLNAREAA